MNGTREFGRRRSDVGRDGIGGESFDRSKPETGCRIESNAIGEELFPVEEGFCQSCGFFLPLSDTFGPNLFDFCSFPFPFVQTFDGTRFPSHDFEWRRFRIIFPIQFYISILLIRVDCFSDIDSIPTSTSHVPDR